MLGSEKPVLIGGMHTAENLLSPEHGNEGPWLQPPTFGDAPRLLGPAN